METLSKALFLKGIKGLDLTVRSHRRLRLLGINTIGELIKLTESDLLKLKDFGAASLKDINSNLKKIGLRLGMLHFPSTRLTDAQKLFLNRSVESCNFSVRSLKCFRDSGIKTISGLIRKSESELMKEKKFGKKSLNEVISLLNEHNLCLGMSIPEEEPEAAAEYKLRCRSLHDWLVFAKDELFTERNLRKIFKKERSVEIFKRRYCQKKGETLQGIGRKLSISKERVRQICSDDLKLLYKSINVLYRVFIDNFISDFHENKKLIVFDEDLNVTGSIEFKLFNLIVSALDKKIVFDNKAKVWRENNNNLLIKIDKFLKKRLKLGDELSGKQIDSTALEFILEYDFTRCNQPAISSLFTTYYFKNYRDKFFYKKICKTNILENIIKRYFPEGIAVYKKKDVLIDTIKNKGYSGFVEFSENSIPQLAIGSEDILLWDWGVYIHKDNIEIEKKILEVVAKWVQDKLKHGTTRVSLYGAFFEFAVECKRAGIHSEHALYTCMKLKYGNKFFFYRAPYIAPIRKKETASSVPVLENYVLGFKNGIKKNDISAGLGLKEYQVAQRLSNSQKIEWWGDGKVIHMDNVDFDKDDLKKIVLWIKRNIGKYHHLSIDRVFEDNVVICKKNNISDAKELYTVLIKYCPGESFLLSRYPIILKKNHRIEGSGYLSLLGHYFDSHSGIITKQQLCEYFVKARGYPRRVIHLPVELPGYIKKYTRGSFVALATIGWSEAKSSALEAIAKKRFKRDSAAGQPFTFVEDLLEREKLPPLDGGISWQKILLVDLLKRFEDIELLGEWKEIYVFLPNKFGIETSEDVIRFILEKEYGGAANKAEFITRLNELKIAAGINPTTNSRIAIKGEEVFIK